MSRPLSMPRLGAILPFALLCAASVYAPQARAQQPPTYRINCSGETEVSVNYSLYVFCSISPSTTVVYELTGSLPTGIQFSAQGYFTGSASVTGTFPVTVRARQGGEVIIASTNLTFKVNPALSITTGSPLADGQVNIAYPLQQLQAAGGVAPYTWRTVQASGPFSVNSQGVVSGTATSANTYTFTAEVTDSSRCTNCEFSTPLRVQKQFQIRVSESIPILSGLTPSSADSCSAGFSLQLDGSNFSDSSQAYWTFGGVTTLLTTNTAGRPGRLTATIPTAFLAVPGQALVFVRTALGNGQSVDTPSQIFIIAPGRPRLDSLTPNTAATGSPDLPVALAGAFFNSASLVEWSFNSGPRVTLVKKSSSCTSIDVTIPATLMTVPGGAEVIVTNNINGSLIASSKPFTISGGVPTLTISPSSAAAGSPNTVLQLTGTNFNSGSTVLWLFNGQTTTLQNPQFLNATSGTVTVPANLLTTAGTAQVSIRNGSTESNRANFVITPVDLTLEIPTPATVPGDQPALRIGLKAAAASDYRGIVTLIFTPAQDVSNWPAGTNNAQVAFATSPASKIANFTIARGATTAIVDGGGSFAVGTVAGTITARITDFNGAPVANPPSVTQTVSSSVPVITASTAKLSFPSATELHVDFSGYSTPRDIARVVIVFQGAGTIQNATQDIPLTNPAASYFASNAGLGAGGSFSLSIPFAYTGDATAVTSAQITLYNSKGPSQTRSATR